MADTYTDRLGLIEQEEGQHTNDWGTLLNLNFSRLDSAIRGYKKITLVGSESLDSGDITTTGDTAQQESFFKFIEFAGTPGASTITVPAEDIVWIVYNNTDADQTFTPAGGTGVTLTQGNVHIIVYGSNGTTFVDMTSKVDLSAIPNAVAVDDTTASTSGTTGSIQTDGGIGAAKDIVTNETFKPLGDTASGDNAAMGYTASDGLILTGNGSTNDVTIKNKGDQGVIKIPTGTRDVELVSGNLIINTSGKGIDFSATADSSGTMQNELLDDYEEGTWTPTITDGTNVATCSVETGKYTKIGRVVTADFFVTMSNKGSVSGNVAIGGLPFNCKASHYYSNVAIGSCFSFVLGGAGRSITGILSGLAGFEDEIYLYLWGVNSGGTISVTITQFGTVGWLTGTISYVT
jgi:hypothetical protein